jgi:hypothetical protein
MAFGQGVNLYRNRNDETLRDYQHASKVFRTNGYANAPRLKFLFHTYFTINTANIPALQSIYGAGQLSTIGVLVKSIQLPQFKIETDTLNQYNRKRVIQKKINYEPVQVEFHDDGGDLIRSMWYNYFAYYYKDPSQKYGNTPNSNGTLGEDKINAAGFSYNNRDIYQNNRAVNDWGYVGESYSDSTNSASGKPPFFRDIRIYGFDQHKFVEYVLVNPLISAWNHDTYEYSSDDGIMKNTMTIQYETVKYYSGAIGNTRPDQNVEGFASDALYDTRPSFLGPPGSTSTITGQGSQLQVGQGQIQDLQAGTVASPVGGTQRADVFYSQKKVFGEAVPSNNLINGTVTTTTPTGTRTVTTETLSGFIPGGLGPMTLEQKLDYLRGQRQGLAGQSRPQPGVNSSGINFPTPGASF